MKTLILALLALVLVAPAATAGSDAEAITAADRAWEAAYNAGDSAAVAALYAADAAVLPPGGARIDGREGIADFWAAAIASGLTAVELDTTEIEVFGDTATTVGYLAGTVPADGGGTTAVAGKFIVIWKRSGDGSWQLYRDTWNLGR